MTFAFQAGAERKPPLGLPKGQADLKRMGKEWFLLQTVTVPDPEPVQPENCVGMDCGLNTVVSAYDGVETLTSRVRSYASASSSASIIAF